MRKYLLKKKVFLKFDKGYVANKDCVSAYVYLENKIFVNSYLIKSGLAVVDKTIDFDLKKKFLTLENSVKAIVKKTE